MEIQVLKETRQKAIAMAEMVEKEIATLEKAMVTAEKAKNK